jgi:hypothetical protein
VESTSHVTSHCRNNLPAIGRRHDLVLAEIVKTITRSGHTSHVNRVFENCTLRPGIVVTTSSSTSPSPLTLLNRSTLDLPIRKRNTVVLDSRSLSSSKHLVPGFRPMMQSPPPLESSPPRGCAYGGSADSWPSRVQ